MRSLSALGRLSTTRTRCWLALAALCIGAVVLNLWWIDTRRRGLPFTIDGAAYLQRAFWDGQALRESGLGGFIRTVRGPDLRRPCCPPWPRS